MEVPDTGPYVHVACFCERVLQEADGVLSAIRIVDRFFIQMDSNSGAGPAPLPPIPATLLIMLKSGSARGTIELRIESEAPDGLRQSMLTVPVLFEGEDRGHNLVLPLELQPRHAGLHWFDLLLEDRLLTRVPLRVVQRTIRLGSGPNAPMS